MKTGFMKRDVPLRDLMVTNYMNSDLGVCHLKSRDIDLEVSFKYCDLSCIFEMCPGIQPIRVR